MKIYIQSKSGNYNLVTDIGDIRNSDLRYALGYLRELGGYHAKYHGEPIFVPFEEIEYVRKAKDND